MKIFLLLCFVSFTAQAAKLESFFSSLEGNWKMDVAQSASFDRDGKLTTSFASRFNASVKREANHWIFSEDMCWSTEGSEDVCSVASVTYEVQGDLLFIIMGDEKLPVQVADIDEENLGITLKTKDYVFNAVISYSAGVLKQDSFTVMSDGSKEYQTLMLLKQ